MGPAIIITLGALIVAGGLYWNFVENKPTEPNSSPTPGPLPPGSGGAGGSPTVIGNNNIVIGGRGGGGGVSGVGGAGGGGTNTGDNMLVAGGEGGEAGQADGRGGRGGRTAFSYLGSPDPVLPDGHRLSDFGRGGAGASSLAYLRYHWEALTPDEMVALRDPLRALAPEQTRILCNDGNCSELAASFVDFFDRLGWPDAKTMQAWGSNADGLTIRPNNAKTREIASAIEKITKGRLRMNAHDSIGGETGIIIAIGRKPPP